MESLRWLVELLPKIEAKRLVINGSFTTDILEPNDVDCVVLIDEDSSAQRADVEELIYELPFLTIELAFPIAFRVYIETIYSSDRTLQPKGMIEVTTWT